MYTNKGVLTIVVRKEVGLRFRSQCDSNGKQANRRLEELIAIWNARGRPDLSEYFHQIESGWEEGRSRFRVHCGFAAMGRAWAREAGVPYYQIFEGIMLEWLTERP